MSHCNSIRLHEPFAMASKVAIPKFTPGLHATKDRVCAHREHCGVEFIVLGSSVKVLNLIAISLCLY